MTLISGNGLKKNAALVHMGLLIETVSVVVCNTLTNGVSLLLRVLCWLWGYSGGGFYPFPAQVPRSVGGFGWVSVRAAVGAQLVVTPCTTSGRKSQTSACLCVCPCLCLGRIWSCFWSRVSWVGSWTTSVPEPQHSEHCRGTSRDAAAAPWSCSLVWSWNPVIHRGQAEQEASQGSACTADKPL